MKKIILHVGSGKAGSTSIQQALLHGRLKNKAQYTYPVIPNSPGNQIIRWAFCVPGSVPQTIRHKYSNIDRGGVQDFQKTIRSLFEEQCDGASTVIVSSEFLFQTSEDEAMSLGIFLRQLGFIEIHVMMYLRDPAKYYISSAQQAMKKQYKIPLPSNFRYDMLGAIDRWSKIMPTSITIREFNMQSLHDGDVVKDFEMYLLSLGVDAKLNIDRPFNESMTSEVTQAIQDCHFHLSENLVNDQVRSEKMRKIRKLIRFGTAGGTKPKLKPEIERYIYNRFLLELRDLHSKYGVFERTLSRIDELHEEKMLDNDFSNICLFKQLVEDFDENVYKQIRTKILDL